MKKFQKLTTAALSLLAVLTIAGCGNAKSGSSAKKDSASSTSVKKAAPSKGDKVSIQSGTFIKPSYAKSLSDGKKYAALNLHIKNQGAKQELTSISFVLKDKDGNKTKPEMISGGTGDFETMEEEKLGHGESVSGYVVFPVKENQKYTLEVSPQPDDYNKKIPVSQVSFSTKGYVDQSQQVQKAMTSYINSVFLNQKSGELNYDKLIANKLDDEKIEFRKQARDVLENTVFTDSLQEEASVKYQVESATPTTAAIEIKPTVVKLNDLASQIDDVHNQLVDEGKIDSNTSYSEAQRKVKEAVAQNMPEVLKDMPVREAQGQIFKLTKQGEKWKVTSSSSDSEYRSLAKAFGGYVY